MHLKRAVSRLRPRGPGSARAEIRYATPTSGLAGGSLRSYRDVPHPRPKASGVTLTGDWLGATPPPKLSKDDDGVWSVTLGGFSGYTIPTRMRVGWHFGTKRFEPEGEFFRVTIDNAAYR